VRGPEKALLRVVAVAAALAAGLGPASLGCGARGQRPLRIGSKNFTEQVLLGELAAGVLERAGVRVDRRLDLGGTFVCHRALEAGELDLYPEYTGTAYTAILAHPPISDPAAVRAAIEREYPGRFHAVWAPPLGFENTFALVMRGPQATELGILSISDLAQKGRGLRPGFGYEFLERADGFPGLSKAYGLQFQQRPAEMDLGLLYAALDQRKVDVVAGNSTDGLIAAMKLVVLRDDRRYFPPYEAAFVVREAVWRDPRTRAALERLSGAISPDAMRAMNAAVDRDRQTPANVAKEFLSRLGK